jgi:two-component system nitrogen regulation sensor histidine kinase NtrY
MASRAFAARLVAQALTVGGALLAYAAWRGDLPANAILCGLVAAGAVAWTLTDAATETSARTPVADPAPPHLDEERRRRTLQAFLDQAPTPLLTLQADRPLTAVNRAARRLFRTDDVLTDPDDELRRAILDTAPEMRRSVRLDSPSGPRTYALSVADVVGAGGALRLVALTDIQAEIQAAEAAALKELLQILSHEIMNSLTPLASLAQSAADLLADGAPDDVVRARDSVEVIARRTDGLHRFVEAYRQLARLPDPAPRAVSLGALLDEAARLFETRWRAAGVVLAFAPPSPEVMIRLDPDLTTQALINLLTNAAEAALAGDAPSPTVWLSARGAADGATLVVEDNGAGVDAAAASKIFRPFFTTKPDGSGIGLSLARQAIVSQGGQLVLTASAAGRGAVFTVFL